MKRHEQSTRPEFFTVDIDAIVCETPATAFDADKIDAGAALIGSSGGLAVPLILKKGSYDPEIGDYRYHVISGALAYHAAVLYAEMNPREGESVNALVIDEAGAPDAAAQAALFR